MTKTYDPREMEYRVDEAVNALNHLVLYCARVLSTDSGLRGVVENVDVKINDVRTHLAETPYSEWIGVTHPNTPRVPCKQCANAGRDGREASWLAPSVIGCPLPEHPDRPWTFDFVPICHDCKSDWWGVNGEDRPAFCPSFMALPDEWVGC